MGIREVFGGVFSGQSIDYSRIIGNRQPAVSTNQEPPVVVNDQVQLSTPYRSESYSPAMFKNTPVSEQAVTSSFTVDSVSTGVKDEPQKASHRPKTEVTITRDQQTGTVTYARNDGGGNPKTLAIFDEPGFGV